MIGVGRIRERHDPEHVGEDARRRARLSGVPRGRASAVGPVIRHGLLLLCEGQADLVHLEAGGEELRQRVGWSGFGLNDGGVGCQVPATEARTYGQSL